MNRIMQQRMTQISRQHNFQLSRQGQQQAAQQTHGGTQPHPTPQQASSRDTAQTQLR
ncbi:MAG: hypothetical protein KDL10_00800 [Kiritimatiellae bacterium]|nr:hypothetical protein [Kiritimatiellia bacterium]